MSTPPRPTTLKSLPAASTVPPVAVPVPAPTGSGAPKVAARQGVPSAPRPDPYQGDGRYPVAWLHIAAPKGAIPTATSKCVCGHDRSAVGRHNVLVLIDDHTAHRDECPLRIRQEGRAAA
ncbi:hypothetical protein ACWDZ6_09405 [Streptomyces sp. NPDC002926]